MTIQYSFTIKDEEHLLHLLCGRIAQIKIRKGNTQRFADEQSGHESFDIALSLSAPRMGAATILAVDKPKCNFEMQVCLQYFFIFCFIPSIAIQARSESSLVALLVKHLFYSKNTPCCNVLRTMDTFLNTM